MLVAHALTYGLDAQRQKGTYRRGLAGCSQRHLSFALCTLVPFLWALVWYAVFVCGPCPHVKVFIACIVGQSPWQVLYLSFVDHLPADRRPALADISRPADRLRQRQKRTCRGRPTVCRPRHVLLYRSCWSPYGEVVRLWAAASLAKASSWRNVVETVFESTLARLCTSRGARQHQRDHARALGSSRARRSRPPCSKTRGGRACAWRCTASSLWYVAREGGWTPKDRRTGAQISVRIFAPSRTQGARRRLGQSFGNLRASSDLVGIVLGNLPRCVAINCSGTFG